MPYPKADFDADGRSELLRTTAGDPVLGTGLTYGRAGDIPVTRPAFFLAG